jgi:hypothetical protein
VRRIAQQRLDAAHEFRQTIAHSRWED